MACDGCTECCTSLPISDIDLCKSAGMQCNFCNNGCTIYENRPESCKNFDCLYSLGESELKPSESHVIFDKLRERVYYGTVQEGYETKETVVTVVPEVERLNGLGISVLLSSFDKGIFAVFPADGHETNKLIEIAINGGSFIHD